MQAVRPEIINETAQAGCNNKNTTLATSCTPHLLSNEPMELS